MFRPLTRSHRRPHRRGTSFILIVVIMTSIMAAVGVAYALFAMQVGRSSDLNKQGQGGGTTTAVVAPNPYNTLNQFFGTLLFDQPDDTVAALTNAMRGHSLAASMYGRVQPVASGTALTADATIAVVAPDATYTPSQADIGRTLVVLGGTGWTQGAYTITGITAANKWQLSASPTAAGNTNVGSWTLLGTNTVPYAGVGTLHEDSSTYLAGTGGAAYGLTGDRAQYINHTVGTLNGNPFLLDPEWTGTRAAATTNAALMASGLPAFAASQSGRAYVGKHVGYSYPDLAHLYEAQVDSATGEVRVPSFHRPWVFGSLDPTNGYPNQANGTPDPRNNWFNGTGWLYTLRPRPAEHPNFPRVPLNADGITYTGDVQNLPGGSSAAGATGPYYAKNDSLWMNLGLPTVKMGNKTVQPLVAPLIIPLNGLFNASAHGNTFGSITLLQGGMPQTLTGQHQSYAGYGPWEVNVKPGLASSLPARGSTTDTVLESDRQAIIGLNNGMGTWNPFGRGQLGQRNPGTLSRPYDLYSTAVVPNSAPVAWTSATVAYPAYPNGTTNTIAGLPGFSAAMFQSGATGMTPVDNTLTQYHPSLFNPTEWPGSAGLASRTYGLSESKRLDGRRAFTPDWYGQSELASTRAPNTLGATPSATPGVPQFPFTASPGTSTTNTYRLDQVHANRGLFTPRGYDLDRPKLVPTFVDANATGVSLTSVTAGMNYQYYKPTPKVATTTYPKPPQTLGAITDFAATNQWMNAMAVLGSVNINRPLADYRAVTTQALSATNLKAPSTPGGPLQADLDRQQLAQDIFVRFAAAAGAGATINTAPTTTTPNAPGGPYAITAAQDTPQYHALRYLAQLAVNIVDYIDNDDISTVFVWNPNPANPPVDFTNPVDVDNRAVFGVEKTRLVINEAYSEVVNDPASITPPPTMITPLPTSANAHVRFWLELLNPTAAPAASSPIGDGSVPLNAYRVEVARANRSILPATVMNQSGNLSAYLTDPRNTTGRLAVSPAGAFTPGSTAVTAAIPDLVYPLSTQTMTPSGATVTTVSPNNSNYPVNGQSSLGMVIVGPSVTQQGAAKIEFNPAPMGMPPAPWSNALLAQLPMGSTPPPAATTPLPANTATTMAYTIPIQTNGKFANTEFKQNVVLLRRLANPYLTTGAGDNTSNPFVTVDVMDYVPSFDSVNYGSGDTMARASGGGTGYDPITSRFSVGKVQPYAAHAYATVTGGAGKFNDYTTTAPFPNTFVLNQKPTMQVANQPYHTFGQHNSVDNGTNPTPPANTFVAVGSMSPAIPGATPTAPMPPTASLTNTLMTPFDWMVHPDRPLVNPFELFQVRDTAPHRVTDLFIIPSLVTTSGNAPPGVSYNAGYANWRDTTSGMTRALEYLAVKPFTSGVPHGGRVPGRINLNAIQDQRVFQGLLDPPLAGTTLPTGVLPGNGFDSTFFGATVSGSYVFGPAANWLGSRTPGGMTTPLEQPPLADGTTPIYRSWRAGSTVYEDYTNGTDRPFTSLGAPTTVPPAMSAFQLYGTAATCGPTDQWSMLRIDPSTNSANNPWTQPTPYLYTNTNNRSVGSATMYPAYPASQTAYVQGGAPDGPSYYQAEIVRKMLNNSTTVNQQYLVFLTIGYFEVVGSVTVSNVNGSPVTIPQLGAEAYVNAPGDARQQFVAVVDMSNMALQPTSNALTTQQPFFTSLEQTARPTGMNGTATLTLAYAQHTDTSAVYVAADGALVPISTTAPYNTLVLGYGTEQQVVTVTSVGDPTMGGAGQVSVTGMTRTAWAGSCVSNVRPGYPGPQPGFQYDNTSTYGYVLPYIQRLR